MTVAHLRRDLLPPGPVSSDRIRYLQNDSVLRLKMIGITIEW